MLYKITVVIQERFNKQQADAFIKQQANTSMPANMRARLIEVVETELGALHEGNIACYRIRPSEFTAWHSIWK